VEQTEPALADGTSFFTASMKPGSARRTAEGGRPYNRAPHRIPKELRADG